ncbi:APC family permease [Lacrimispora sp.]|uniref:APC family permease n=1 Tax=Lacrimispora sp. TaxID=2719234 RepID=UPI00289DF368|nr:APC family permease [Lacrimispora sp.]
MMDEGSKTVMSERETLRTPALVWITVGNMVGSGIMVLSGAAASETGYSVWLAFVVATVLGFLGSWPQILAAGTSVLEGGMFSLNSYFGHPVYGGLYLMGTIPEIMGQASVALGIGLYIRAMIPGTNIRLVAVVIALVFYLCNIWGVEMVAGVQKYMVYILFAGLGAFTISGLKNLNSDALQFTGPNFMTHGWKGFIIAVNMLTFSTQSYWASLSFSKFAKTPKKTVPKAMIITFPIIMFIYGLVTLAGVGGVDLNAFAGNTLGDIAKVLFPGWMFYLFIIGAPMMALATTLNGNQSAYSLMIAPAAEEGWLPSIFSKSNKKGMPYISATFVALLIILPVLFNWDITFITANVMLFTNLAGILQYIAMWRMPKRYPELWSQSTFHMNSGLYNLLMVISFLVRMVLVVAAFISLNRNSLMINLTVAVALSLFCIFRFKKGYVNPVPIQVHTDLD